MVYQGIYLRLLDEVRFHLFLPLLYFSSGILSNRLLSNPVNLVHPSHVSYSELMLRDNLFEMVTSFRTFYIQVTSRQGDTLLDALFEPELGAEAVSLAGRQPRGHAQLDQSHIGGHRGSERSWTPSQHRRSLSTLSRTHTRGTSYIQLKPSDSS